LDEFKANPLETMDSSANTSSSNVLEVYTICHCGSKESPHLYRHAFVQTSILEYKQGHSGKYVWHLTPYALVPKIEEYCTLENCNATKGLHNGLTITHPYQPGQRSYREINWMVPGSVTCDKCNVRLDQHRSVMTHIFVVPLVITDYTSTDRVVLTYDQDRDMKITWTNPK
jgi:hypothetical protein